MTAPTSAAGEGARSARPTEHLTVASQMDLESGVTVQMTATAPENLDPVTLKESLAGAAGVVADAFSTLQPLDDPPAQVRVIAPILDPSAPFTVATHAVHHEWITAMLRGRADRHTARPCQGFPC